MTHMLKIISYTVLLSSTGVCMSYNISLCCFCVIFKRSENKSHLQCLLYDMLFCVYAAYSRSFNKIVHLTKPVKTIK